MAPTNTKEAEAKLLRAALADPGSYDGNRTKFNAWWENMQLWLLGYEDLSDTAKIISILTRLKSGDALDWAQNKKQRILDGQVITLDDFKKQVKERFSDPARKEKAQHEIHTFTQGKLPLQTYLDKFAVLKAISGIDSATAFYLLK
jgi:hypothetical protein